MTRAEQQQEWETRIADYKASGQSAKEWCAANGMKPHQLWYRLRHDSAVKTGPVTSTRWLSVAVAGPTPGEHDDDALLIRIGEAYSIEVRSGFDPDLLSGVVRILAASC
jgi:hypothetical protein